MPAEGDGAGTDEVSRAGCVAAVVVLAVVLALVEGAAWAWANPLLAAAVMVCVVVLGFGLRWGLVRAGLVTPLLRFLAPRWALIQLGATSRVRHAWTGAIDAATDRLDHWAHQPLRPVPPPEPAASYEWRPLGFTLEAFDGSSPTGFEDMCRALLERDGFTDVQRVGGAGDLGADVTARDGTGRRIVVQCKRYAKPVGSQDAQRFNGTARPEHRATVPILVGLNGFTAPTIAFAQKHLLHLVDRERLARWGAGQHLYDVLGIDRANA